MLSGLNAALFYAERFGPVAPWNSQTKKPLTEHGILDATRDAAQIAAWWKRWPQASPALATGEISGVVALDVDGLAGFDSLEEIAGPFHPVTPTDHTPRGGCHLLFRHPGPGHFVKTIAGKLGVGLDIRGDGGSIMLPPGPGRRWDDHLGPDAPLAPMPAWMVIPEEPKPVSTLRPAQRPHLTRYAEAALDNAVKAIVSAPSGQQHQTLNRECFAIGGLVAAGALPAALALESLGWAARQMPSYDRRRHWRPADLDRQVRNAFVDGQVNPRQVAS